MTTTGPAARRSEESATDSAARAEAERVLAEAFEHSPEVFLWVDPDRSVRYFNRTAAEKAPTVHGLALRRGDSIDRVLRLADRAEFDKHFQRALDGEATRVPGGWGLTTSWESTPRGETRRAPSKPREASARSSAAS